MSVLAYYALNEASMDAPDVATDSSGNGFNGAYYGPDAYGGNTPVAGCMNNGMKVLVPVTYPDPNDRLGHAGMRAQAVADFSFSGATDPFDVRFCLNLGGTDTVQRRALIGSYDPSVPPLDYKAWGFYIEGNETKVRLFRGDFSTGRDEAVTTSLTPGAWYDIRGAYDGTDLIVYVDDSVEDTTTGTVGALSASAASLSVGGGVPLQVIFGFKSFRYPPNGTILDEVYVYDELPGASATIAFYGGVAE